MEISIVNGVSCVKRDVDNIDVYKILKENSIDGIPPIIKLEGNTVYYQFINGMTLREYLQVNGKMFGENLTKFIFELANILEKLKNTNIVHKDLKPENIVISQSNKIYLIDFDVSRLSNPKEEDTTLFGTRGYASPEHFGYSSTSFKSDMFSLGRIIEEIDEHFYYRKIASKCTEIDPRNRYNDYSQLIKDLNSRELKVENSSKKINYNILNAYSKKIIIIYSILFILFFSIGSSNIKTGTDLIYNFLASFYMVDIIDYIRVIIMKRNVIKYKSTLSGIVLSTGVFILVIIDLLK